MSMNASTLPVLPENEPLVLSSGALSAYHDCPRKFFYQALLRLPSATGDPAELGKLWHSIMEVFHHQPDQSMPVLQALVAEVTRKIPRNPDRWKTSTLEWLDNLSPLRQRDVHHYLEHTVANLLTTPLSTLGGESYLVEHPLEYTLEPSTRFRLRLDLAYSDKDGYWHIVDYKTYGSGQFTQKRQETLEAHLVHVLHAFKIEADQPHRMCFPLAGSKPFIYQLPLYWLAAEQNPAAFKALSSFSLYVLRPAEKGPCVRVGITVDTIEAILPVFREHLQEWVKTAIRQVNAFRPEPEGDPCGRCDYESICPRSTEDPNYQT